MMQWTDIFTTSAFCDGKWVIVVAVLTRSLRFNVEFYLLVGALGHFGIFVIKRLGKTLDGDELE